MPRPPTPFPRAIVTFNGQAVRWTDLLQVVWQPNVAYLADGLTVTLRNLTSEGLLLSDAIKKKQTVDLYLGYVADPDVWSQNELPHRFTGKVDGVVPTFAEGMTLQVFARDLSASMIDTQIGASLNAESFDNMTASDFAAFYAKKYGLGAQISATAAVADRRNFENQSEWNLLVVLAMREGFICSVDKDGVLYFGPRRTNQPILSTWSYYTAPADLLSFTPNDSGLFINRVTVLRYAGEMQDFSGSWPTEDDLQTDPAILAAGGQVIDYTTYSVTAQSSDDCQDEAQKLYTTMNRRRISAAASMEGDPTLIGDALIHIGGQVGRFENDYYIDAASHTLDVSTGYLTEVDLTNIEPAASEVYRDPLYQPVDAITHETALVAIQGAAPSGDCAARQQQLLAYAQTFLGAPYVWGGDVLASPASASHLDCSGYVGLCFQHMGVALPRVAEAQQGACTAVPAGQQQPGDLVFFAHNPGSGAFHVGIVWSDPTQMINETPPHVQIQPIPSTWGVVSYGRVPGLCPAAAPTGAGPGQTSGPAKFTASTIGGAFSRAPSFVQQAIIQAGFPPSEYDNAAAISYNESGWVANGPPSPTNDWGLFQINRGYHPLDPSGQPWTNATIYDPNTNARSAYQIWTARAASGQNGWCAWATAPALGLC